MESIEKLGERALSTSSAQTERGSLMCQANRGDRKYRATHGCKETDGVVCHRVPVGRVVLGALLLLTMHWTAIRVSYALDLIIVNSTGDEADVRPRNGICETAPGNRNCTLRAALEEINFTDFGLHTIKFDIPMSDRGCNATTRVCTITPGIQGLPVINRPVFIDGYTQPGARANTNSPEAGSNAELKIELNGENAGESDALSIVTVNSTVRGLVINRFGGAAINLFGSDNGGHNIIQGNFIGTDVTGMIGLGNCAGIAIRSPDNLIGGTTPAARNLISGNRIPCESFNAGHGIRIIVSVSVNNRVEGNLIGTDVTGMTPLGNLIGVGIYNPNTSRNTIGGTTDEARNIISGNTVSGIVLNSGLNTVSGNFIGTDVTGQAALGNRRGVIINNGFGNTVGISVEGTGKGNVISGNTDDGIRIIGFAASDNAVLGNLIGTDATGRIGLGNEDEGIEITDAPGNIIGGESSLEANVISDNFTDGIRIQGDMATGNLVRGNLIGTDITGTVPLPNESDGVEIRNASSNQIGGTTSPGAGNIIVFKGSGVKVRTLDNGTATGNAILSNLITSNLPAAERGLSIDLGGDGLTPNDRGDSDTGPNNLQNSPNLSSARNITGGTRIQGTLNSTSNRSFRLQFFSNGICNPLNKGVAERFIASTAVSTNTAGDANFNIVTQRVPINQFIIATATDNRTNDTSEFSRCVRVTE